jgi:hypothetical protein
VKRIVWVFAAILIASALVGVEAQSEQTKPRVYVTDSTSWDISGGWGESGGAGGGSVKGGARPQTAEIIKTFGERCPEIVVNNKKELAEFVVILDHEGGKGVARKRNKIAVFNKNGDSIFSDSTRSLGNSVKDACGAIVSDFEHNPRKPISSSAETLHESTPASAAAPTQPVASAVSTPAPSTAADGLANVVVKSTPDGADISVDGIFVGNTPSTLRLSPRDHTVAVAAAGFKSWQRTMTLVSGSSVTLNATLEKAQ